MKKITLSLLMLSMVATTSTVMAQENVDVTPPNYVFANQQVGPFVFGGVGSQTDQSNAPAKFAAAKSDEGGYAYLTGWGDFRMVDGVDKGNTPYMRQMSNIVDLGGEVGKVLCFKGHACTDDVFPYGIKPVSGPAGGDLGWPLIAFYMGSKINKADYANKKYTARLSITWRICLPTDKYDNSSLAYSLRVNDYSINTKNLIKGNIGEQLEGVVAETEEADVWCKQEADFEFNGDSEQIPLLFKFSFQKFATISTLLIKEMKLTINPTGNPVALEPITLAMNPPSSVENEIASAYNYTVEGDNLVINNLAGEEITLYNTLGTTLTSFTATQSSENISLKENGMFILKIGNNSFKVIK